jgi:Outer membrane protein and related peptidoglycan-associated (lipo)proteins
MKKSLLAALAAALALLVVGCATKPKAPAAVPGPEPSSIQAEAGGLAPSGDERYKTITFAVLIGNRDSVSAWSVAISDEKQKRAVFTASGDASNLPDRISWDGKGDSGAMAPEGSYVASLSVDYGGKLAPATASSKAFVLDISPPACSFSPNPAGFAYSPDGIPKPISVTVSAKSSLAKVGLWNIDIFDAGGVQVKALSGAFPAAQAAWDGKLDSGSYVESAKRYPAVLTVSDEFGNQGRFTGTFAVADVPTAMPSSISTMRVGFSPTSASVKNTLDLLLDIGSRSELQAWKVTVLKVANGSAVPIRVFSGSSSDAPDYVRWDGKDDSGALVAEGSYYATLGVDYGKTYKPILVKSRNFSVVMTPPSGSITVDPPSVSLASLGPRTPVAFTVQAKSAYAQIASWIMAVYDDSGISVAVFNANWPNNKAAWDGKPVGGGTLVPGSRYSVVAKVQDEYGNVGELSGSLFVEGLEGATEPSSIEALSSGFAPTGDGSSPSMDFKIDIGNAGSLVSWKVDILDEQNIVERSFKGDGKQAPASLVWDGKLDSGGYASEGRYSAMLSLDYGVAFAPVTQESRPFVLDLTPPTGTLGLSTELFSPDGDGVGDSETFAIGGSSKLARITGWSLSVYDPGNNVFMSWKGLWPAGRISWDGIGADGSLVESASDYPLVLKLRDEFGNIGTVSRNLPTDILVLKTGDGYRIRVSSIVFKGFTADYMDVPADRAARNLETLDLIAAKLKLPAFADYKVKLEGHAVMINWNDATRGAIEQSEVLVPLSKARADAIDDALAERGIDRARLVTDGVGAKDPIVPDSDFANRWKNRRVEFYLLK